MDSSSLSSAGMPQRRSMLCRAAGENRDDGPESVHDPKLVKYASLRDIIPDSLVCKSCEKLRAQEHHPRENSIENPLLGKAASLYVLPLPDYCCCSNSAIQKIFRKLRRSVFRVFRTVARLCG
ncbi:hypothetical protein CRG98_044196 [Punica granatum]|uniref:Uncharacterized protein n=1 Tax=Punica granatum TaxID=22663 RepID=A0A2I0HVX0_PUNGR|nr:hypothetical protein CRG98_044196 [Punica granatum]